MNKFEKIKDFIKRFENDEDTLEYTLQSINEISEKEVSEYELTNYWRSSNLKDFAQSLLVNSITDWSTLDDFGALELINEILSNLNNDSLISRNAETLEKKYAKASGTISDWIFQDDISDPKVILKLLKENTTLLL